MLLTAYAAQRAGRVSVVDVTWGLALAAIAVAAAVVGTGTPWRRWLVAALVLVWGARLARHIFTRGRGGGEDPRYAEILGDGGLGHGGPQGLRRAGTLALPDLAAGRWQPRTPTSPSAGWCGPASSSGRSGWSSSPSATPSWRRTGGTPSAARSWTVACGPGPGIPTTSATPCLWWGIWVVGGAASGWLPALLTVASPVVMTHFLRNVTGARLLERTMSTRPGWDAYAARVPLFVPRPPRRAGAHRG